MDQAKTSGFASISRFGPGQYCLEPESGVQVRNRAVVASLDWTNTNPPEGTAEVMFLGNCGTNGIAILTERTLVSSGVLVSNSGDGIAFHVIVP